MKKRLLKKRVKKQGVWCKYCKSYYPYNKVVSLFRPKKMTAKFWRWHSEAPCDSCIPF